MTVIAPFAAFALALGASASVAQAALDYDPQDYSGTMLNGQNGGSGWLGPWFQTGTSPSITLATDAASLNYPATFQSPLTTPESFGTRISTGGIASNASSSRLISNTTSLAVDGNVLYASALIRKNVDNGGGVNNDNILLEFTDAAGNRRFGLGIEGTGDKPWLNANGSTTPPTGPAVTPGETYFIVAKILSSASGTDQAFLKVYGTGYGSEVSATEPTVWDATLTQTTGAILDRVRVRIDPGNTAALPGEVDDIRVATDWATVVNGIPEPSSLALLSLGALAGLRRRRRAI
jgi:hypothetical protein